MIGCPPFPPLALLEGFHYDADYFELMVAGVDVDGGGRLSPEVWVSDANGCVLAAGADLFDCTYPGFGDNQRGAV